jgi:elongation factor G
MKKILMETRGGAPTNRRYSGRRMDKAMEMHKALVEAAAENDEILMEKFYVEQIPCQKTKCVKASVRY